MLSGVLNRRGIQHHVLNAKNHEKEAVIVAQAGRKGSVTVATNMAGRGVDILLGGNPEYLARQEMAAREWDNDRYLLFEMDEEERAAYEAEYEPILAKFRAQTDAEHDEVVGLGGLYVLGTERHESRRIDNQLRGRSGRQGDPGESLFYLSLEDDLMRMFASDRVAAIMDRFKWPEDEPIEAKMVSRAVENAQKQIEELNYERRKNVLKYDEVMNAQRAGDLRRATQDPRRPRPQGTGARLRRGRDRRCRRLLVPARYLPGGLGPRGAAGRARGVLPCPEHGDGHRGRPRCDRAPGPLRQEAEDAYEAKEVAITPEVMRELERVVLLNITDTKWREHLYEMDYLQEGHPPACVRPDGTPSPSTSARRS